jgi:hypothetical protein
MYTIMSDRTIYTKDGDPIPYFYGSVDDYVDRTVLLFGGSGKGKTTVIEHILYTVKDHIPNYLVITPRTSDKTYRKKLPARCIKEDLTKHMLTQIWDRQSNITQIYETANDVDVLASLFDKCPDRRALVMIKAIKQRAFDSVRAIDASSMNFATKKDQKAHIEELQLKKVTMLYKASIRQMRQKLSNMQLSDKETVCLTYLDINPRLMIIIDDCSEKWQMWQKMFGKDEINPFNSIFFRGRHNNISLVFAAHDDKLIDTGLRKGARVTVYCGSKALMASIGKSGSGFTSQDKKLAQRMATEIFNEDDSNVKSHKKLCYVATASSPWMYHVADLHPEYDLGCEPLRELVDKMPKKEDNLTENPFLKGLISQKEKPKNKRPPRYASKRR